jgi:hypothetical protein
MDRWSHDIGREQAACKPLLKTVFQVFYINMNLVLFGIQCLNLYSLTFLLFLGYDAFI